ncbi:MAG TPA: NACHT domain-containing protein, partial [Polyangiaceae bacterium]|nr:NACHT domain-containing protein [Polyangiaceae bacterium]
MLMMHHPINWQHPDFQKAFKSDVYPPDRFDLCLYGHMHKSQSIAYATGGGQSRADFQSPSIFGLAGYRTKKESRIFGYAFGECRESGEIRLWPMRHTPKGDGGYKFEPDSRYQWKEVPSSGAGAGAGAGADEGVAYREYVEFRPADGRSYARDDADRDADANEAGSGAREPTVTVDEPVAVTAYREWLESREPKVDMIGVAGGEMKLDLDAIYVALQLAPNLDHGCMPGSDGRRSLNIGTGSGSGQETGSAGPIADECALEQSFDVEALFGTIKTRHALILGHPGSGKTTVLKKLRLSLSGKGRGGAESLNLPAGTLPVWLPLRHFSAARRQQPLSAWLAHEVAAELGEDALPTGLGAALWDYGRLLLLADGLDEVANESDRVALCDYLESNLQPAKGVRAIVSCRFTGYRREVRLSEAAFTPLELRALNDTQAVALVRLWFQEALKAMPTLDRATTQKRSAELISALRSPLFVDERRAAMRSTPLLLTILCVIVNSGQRMPDSRALFYERGLEVMLSSWGKKTKEWTTPPVDFVTATEILQVLGYALHSAGKRDDLPYASLLRVTQRRLGALRRDRSQAHDVLGWLLEHAGVLREFAKGHLGFFHLGMQEYLTAAYIASERGQSLDRLVDALGDSWWHEIARLLVGLPNQGMFKVLVGRLLERDRSWPRFKDLVYGWIDESPVASAAPLVAHARGLLSAEGTPALADELLAVCGLFEPFVRDEDVQALIPELEKFAADAQVKVTEASTACTRWDLVREQCKRLRKLEAELACSRQGSGAARTRSQPLALLFRETQRATAETFSKALADHNLHLLRTPEGPLWAAEALVSERMKQVSEEGAGVIVIADSSGPAFEDDESGIADAIEVWAAEGKPIFGARLGGDEPTWP